MLALITVHLLIRTRQKHTQFPGPGRTEDDVVGSRLFPTDAGRATGLFLMVSAVCAALGGLVQINPVWLWGPYDPAHVSAATQPDWYTLFLDGASRLFPAWDLDLPGGYTDPARPTVLFLWVAAVSAPRRALGQINPVCLGGPSAPAHFSAAPQPDWSPLFLAGRTRLSPAWDLDPPAASPFPAMFWPTVVLP